MTIIPPYPSQHIVTFKPKPVDTKSFFVWCVSGGVVGNW